MSDTIITTYGIAGYTVHVDAETVTTTAGEGTAVRPRVVISARDVTAGTPTDVGDASLHALRVNLVSGTVNANATPNVTVTNWTYANPITITGNLTANVNNVSITNVVSVTQNTTPWTVTYSQGLQAVTVTQIPVTLSQVLASVTQGTTPWAVTFSAGAQVVTYSAGTQVVTYSAGTQVVSLTTALPWPVTQSGTPWFVSATQGTNPWTVTVSGVVPVTVTGGTLQGVTVTGWAFTGSVTTTGAATPNVTITNWTYANPVTVTGTLTATSTPNVTVTNWTVPGTVTITQFYILSVTFSATQPVVLRPQEALGFYRAYQLVPGQAWAQSALVAAVRWTDASKLFQLQRLSASVMVTSAVTTQQLNPLRAFVARGYTAFDSTNATAVTITGNDQKMRTSMANSLLATSGNFSVASAAAGMTGGTSTNDGNAIGHVGLGQSVPIAGLGTGLPLTTLYEGRPNNGQHPLTLAQNEGLHVRWGSVALASGAIQVELLWEWMEANTY